MDIKEKLINKNSSEQGKTIVVYKDRWERKPLIYAGLLVSKKKICKIRGFASGHFNGYKTLVQMEDVIAILPVSAQILEYLKEAEKTNREWDTKVKELENQQSEAIEKIIKKIKECEPKNQS